MNFRRMRVAAGEIVDVVSDAVWASEQAEGKALPILVLDTTAHPLVEQAINEVGGLPMGDVSTNWGCSPDESVVYLRLDFIRPIRARASIRFHVATQGVLVDLILHARVIMLQSGTAGTKFRDNFHAPRLQVGVALNGFEAEWERIFQEQTARKFRDRGVPRKQAPQVAREAIADVRRISRLQLPASDISRVEMTD